MPNCSFFVTKVTTLTPLAGEWHKLLMLMPNHQSSCFMTILKTGLASLAKTCTLLILQHEIQKMNPCDKENVNLFFHIHGCALSTSVLNEGLLISLGEFWRIELCLKTCMVQWRIVTSDLVSWSSMSVNLPKPCHAEYPAHFLLIARMLLFGALKVDYQSSPSFLMENANEVFILVLFCLITKMGM